MHFSDNQWDWLMVYLGYEVSKDLETLNLLVYNIKKW